MKVATFSEYHPHEHAKLMHRASNFTGREVLVVAAKRSGKTFSLRYDIVKSAWNNPFADFAVLVTAPEYKQLGPLLEDPITEMLSRRSLLKKHNQTDHETRLMNGRKIFYRSLDNYHAIEGLDICKAYIDEGCLPKKEAIDVVRSRLLTTNGGLIITTSPKGTANWLYQEYFGIDAKPHPNCTHVRYEIFDNPLMTQAAIDRYAAEVDRLTYRQDILAQWVNLTEQRVYHAFDDKLNVAHGERHASEIYIGLDYNIGINAWIAIQKDAQHDTLHVLAEGYGAKTTRDVAAQIQARFGDHAIIVDDASGAARQQGDGKTQRELLRQAGLQLISAYTANPERLRRYACTNAHFENGLGRRKLYIDPSCKRLIHELNELCFKKNGSDEPDDQQGKAGHITDALGYAVWFVSGGTAAWSTKLAA